MTPCLPGPVLLLPVAAVPRVDTSMTRPPAVTVTPVANYTAVSPGRPHKGPRRFMATRLPEQVADALLDRANRDGLTVNDALHRAVESWLADNDDQRPQGESVP